MIKDQVRPGLRVRTTTLLQRSGVFCEPKYLDNRKEGVEGIVESPSKLADGVWWVRFPHGLAPIWYFELERLEDQSGPLWEGWTDPVF
jgi:hypothetical protein